MMVAGEAFNVLVEGEEGAPVLMLAHSLGTNLHVFDRLMPELLRHFRIVRYDGRGHGASVVTPGPYSMAELGQDALAILDALKLEKVHWLGLSKGGMVGLWLLTHAPERIGRAVLANVAAQVGNPDMWNERIKAVHEKGLGSLAPSVLENWFTKAFREHHPDEVDRLWDMLLATPAEGYAGACAAIRDMDQREAIRAITNPVLVIVGRHDPITPPGVGALVASAIPGAKLVTLETAHMSCVEDPEGFNQAAIEFLTAEEPVVAEKPEHEAAPEAPPAKKPRKPRAPRQPPAAAVEVQGEMAPTAAMPPQAEAMPALALPVPLPPPRKPRKPRPAAAPAAPPAIVVAPPQPRKRPAKKAAAKKVAAKKAPAKKMAAKKVAAKKSPARKVVGKKVATKKTAMRKLRAAAPARKPVVKKTVAKKAVAKKAVVKKGVAKKAVAKKAVVKKAPMRKIAAKKALMRKAIVKKTQAKKAGVKKAATKKATRKPMRRHLPGRRPPARKR